MWKTQAKFQKKKLKQNLRKTQNRQLQLRWFVKKVSKKSPGVTYPPYSIYPAKKINVKSHSKAKSSQSEVGQYCKYCIIHWCLGRSRPLDPREVQNSQWLIKWVGLTGHGGSIEALKSIFQSALHAISIAKPCSGVLLYFAKLHQQQEIVHQYSIVL